MKNKKRKIHVLAEDWKDTESIIGGFKKAIRKLGGHVYKIPSFNGSDCYGFIISDTKLTKKQIKEIDMNEFQLTNLYQELKEIKNET